MKSDYSKIMAAGAQLGSFAEQIAKSPYSNFLGTEVSILQRKIYLPLLPQERIGYGVLKAYDYMAQEEAEFQEENIESESSYINKQNRDSQLLIKNYSLNKKIIY